MGREKAPITTDALLPLCRPCNTDLFWLCWPFSGHALSFFWVARFAQRRWGNRLTVGPGHGPGLSFRASEWGAIMYALANIDFSNRFGVVVSELPDEIDDKDQTLDAKRGAALIDLEMAVFGAA